MKAVRYHGPGDVRVEEIDEPVVKEGQVKIKIAWNGICGTDLHMYLIEMPGLPTATKPNMLTGEKLPITMGHEFSGTIAELGEGVDAEKWKVGQNVIVEPLLSCLRSETCYPCAKGEHNVCQKVTFIGVGGGGGGLAEYISVGIRHVHALPDGISLEVGAMIEPLAVAWHAVKKSQYKVGQSALIMGAGPIGLFLLKVLRSIDPNALIIVSEPTKARRELALRHGASKAVNPLSAEGIVLAVAYGETYGTGVDVAFDAAGIQQTLNTALMCVRSHGTFVNVSIWEKNPTVHLNLVVAREITIIGTLGYCGDHAELLEAVAAGRLPGLEDLITRKIAMEDVVKDGILALVAEKDTQIKILVHP